MPLFGFGGRRAPVDHGARDAVAAWARTAGGFDETVIVKVNEIVCADPACPGTETVILVMAPGRPAHAVKVAKPMSEVTQADVAVALVNGS